jgi:hypothetical protein
MNTTDDENELIPVRRTRIIDCRAEIQRLQAQLAPSKLKINLPLTMPHISSGRKSFLSALNRIQAARYKPLTNSMGLQVTSFLTKRTTDEREYTGIKSPKKQKNSKATILTDYFATQKKRTKFTEAGTNEDSFMMAVESLSTEVNS